MGEPRNEMCVIRAATAADVSEVVRLASEHELTTKSPDRVSREGFLISGYPHEKYLRWLAHLRIAQVGGQVAGFTLSFRRSVLPTEVEDSDRVYEAAGNDDFLLFKQVGVSATLQKQGIGRKLYLADMSELSCPAFAPIIVAPQKNAVSIGFHEALGFRCVSKYVSGGKERGIWRRDPQAQDRVLIN